MGAALNQLEAYEKSPENALVNLVPWLTQFRAYCEKLSAIGHTMSDPNDALLGLSDTSSAGISVSGDTNASEMAATAKAALQKILEIWRVNATADGRCVALPAFAEAMTFLDDPKFAAWLRGGEAYNAYQSAWAAIYRAATIESRDEQREKVRHSLAPGMEVALCSIGGWPVEFARIAAGTVTEGYLLEDGRGLTFMASSHGSWVVKDGETGALVEGLLARPAKMTDHALRAARAGRLTGDGIEVPSTKRLMPQNPFATTLTQIRDEPMSTGSSDLDVDDIVGEVLPGLEYGKLLAYMLRRFGPAPRHGDDYKDLCGSWLLTTPLQDVHLLVHPSVTGPDFCFRAVVSKTRLSQINTLRRRQHQEDETDGGSEKAYIKALAEITTAIRTAMVDLKRGVFVRDQPINALGHLDDNDPLASKLSQKYSEASTVGLANLLADCEAFRGLLDALHELDPDMPTALRKANVLLTCTPDREPGISPVNGAPSP